VHGRLRLRAWDNGEKSGTAIEIEAEAIGHDLTWGTTVLTKVRREPAADAEVDGASEPSAWPGSDGVAVPSGLGPAAEADEGVEPLGSLDEVDADEAQLASAV
jgi:single-strand DNA-binding protein